jgi:hypothetical protein
MPFGVAFGKSVQQTGSSGQGVESSMIAAFAPY